MTKCHDCKFKEKRNGKLHCTKLMAYVSPTDYCSWAEDRDVEETCRNCKHLKKLIMWEYNSYGAYRPNYDRPLSCCTVLDDVVHGDTMVNLNDHCEMWELKEPETDCMWR